MSARIVASSTPEASRRPRRRAAAIVSADGFEPARHEGALRAIFAALAAHPAPDARALDRILRRHPKDGRGLFSKAELIEGYRRLLAPFVEPAEARATLDRLTMRPVRTQSGVTPVTVLTKPYPCPGRCVFCPSDVRMPKSYLSDEPGAQRATDNGFDPYRQTWSRLAALRAIGHRTDKVELLVLGGTWSFYPEAYRVWFVERCLAALCDFSAGRDGRATAPPPACDFEAIRERVDGAAKGPGYNRVVSAALARAQGGRLDAPAERASFAALRATQRRAETAACRNVGLVLETRPDCVDEAELLRLRRLGATKVQLGAQSLSDAVLAASRRGHDVAATRRALRLLRAAGFKLLLHWMPNLPGATPESDVADYARLFDDVDFRPDELKIYPCSLVESAELMALYRRGDWRPYTEETLLEVLVACLRRTPPWCRLARVIRDIPSTDIVAGSRTTNLREVAEARLRAGGGRGRDIRARELRGARVDPAHLALRVRSYDTSVGRECFLELATPGDRLAGFLRLSLPATRSPVAELGRAAVIREVHVYGTARALGEAPGGAAQHAGLGRRLAAEARRCARAAGARRLAVISAIGTRDWYRAQGFEDGPLYQHCALAGSGG